MRAKAIKASIPRRKNIYMAVSCLLLSMKWVYPGRPKKGVPGTLGRRAWKRLFWFISKGFGLVRLSLLPWGSVYQEKLDEDLFFCLS